MTRAIKDNAKGHGNACTLERTNVVPRVTSRECVRESMEDAIDGLISGIENGNIKVCAGAGNTVQ